MPKKQKQTLRSKASSKFTRFMMMISSVAVAGVGVYFLVFSQAAPNNCSAVAGGAICDVNQASHPGGIDSAFSVNDEVANLVKKGWTDWGVAFRAPNTAINGAKPVHRFYRADITAHTLVIESDPKFNEYKSDPAYVHEGVYFYAWDRPGEPGTEEVYRINRKPWYFLQMYSTNEAWVNQFVSNPDGTWENGGVGFYAYPANYFPPKPASTPTKDTNCSTANIQPGDRGACIQWHKGVLNGYLSYHGNQSPKLDTGNNEFDSKTGDYTRLFVASLKNKGVNVPAYSNVVTREIWDALAKGYPAAPATPSTPAQPPAVPGRTNTSSGGVSSSSGSGGSNVGSNPCDSPEEQKTQACIDFFTAVQRAGNVCPKQGEEKKWVAMTANQRKSLPAACQQIWTEWEKQRTQAAVDAVNRTKDIIAQAIETAGNRAGETSRRPVSAGTCNQVVSRFLRAADDALGFDTLLGTVPKYTKSSQVNSTLSTVRTYKNQVASALNSGSCSLAENIARLAYTPISGAYSVLSSAYSTAKTAASVTLSVGKNVVVKGTQTTVCVVTRLWCD